MSAHLCFQEVDSRKRPAGDGAGAGKAGAPPTLTLAGVPEDAVLVCRGPPDPRSNTRSRTVTVTQSHDTHPYSSSLLPIQSHGPLILLTLDTSALSLDQVAFFKDLLILLDLPWIPPPPGSCPSAPQGGLAPYSGLLILLCLATSKPAGDDSDCGCLHTDRSHPGREGSAFQPADFDHTSPPF